MSAAPHTSDLDAALLAEVTEALDRVHLHDTTVLVGVSGGGDSLALLRLLVELRLPRNLTLIAAHLDHALRPDSAADAAWVADVCTRMDVPLQSERIAGIVAAALISEDDARQVRREFLIRSARRAAAQWVALGHTADDQVETILHRLLRGTGPRGLAGMAPAAPLADGVQIVRPLLSIGRLQLEHWLRQRSLDWQTDLTNADPRFTRNRLRHHLLPLLREQFNPQVDAALLRLGRQCRELEDWLAAAADAALAAALLERQRDTVRLLSGSLATLPTVVRRELFVRLWRQQQWPEQRLTCEHWESLANLAGGQSSTRRVQLPGGIDACIDQRVLRLVRQTGAANTAAEAPSG